MNYDEMVKMAYEDIVEGFEKEASTAFDRWARRNWEDLWRSDKNPRRAAAYASVEKSAIGKSLRKIVNNPAEHGELQPVNIGGYINQQSPAEYLRRAKGNNEQIREGYFNLHRGNTLGEIKERAHITTKRARDFRDTLADIKANR